MKEDTVELFGEPAMFEGNWTTIVPVIGVILTGIGVYFAWRSARERQLRLDDVLNWSNEVIRSMQTLYLVSLLGEKNFAADDAKTIRRQIALDTSVLVEQGRMFFKNFPDPEHGKDKPPAYRGYRADILDPIVVAHQIACQWDAADADARTRMTLVAEDSVRRFVSMAQKEVGRGATQSREIKGGKGDTLEMLVRALDAQRVAQVGSKTARTEDGA